MRAHAGGSSFRREKTLQECLQEAKEQVRKLSEERENETAGDARREAARKRAATERQERLEKALEERAKLEAQKEERKKGTGKEARCSKTDPEARIMKMGDGGFRPAYNVQLMTDGDARIIVGVDVTNVTAETESNSTLENARAAGRLLGPGGGKVVLLTSDYHVWRAYRVFRKAGLAVDTCPVPDVGKRWNNWDARAALFVELASETAKIGWYRWKGWI